MNLQVFDRSPAALRLRANQARTEFIANVELLEAAETLAAWFQILREPPYDAIYPDSRLRNAYDSDSDNPVQRSTLEGNALPLAFSSVLTRYRTSAQLIESLEPQHLYVFGRAAMRAMMRNPTGSQGLSLAYGLLRPFGVGDSTEFAADDELLEHLEQGSPAFEEIRAEAYRLSKSPESAAENFDKLRTEQAIIASAIPRSLEACTFWNLPLEIPFARIVLRLALYDEELATSLIEQISNPALVSEIFRLRFWLDLGSLVRFLDRVAPVFYSDGRWNGATTAWLAVLEVEERLLQELREEANAARLQGRPAVGMSGSATEALCGAVDTVLRRPDGRHLALHWLAHAIWQSHVRPAWQSQERNTAAAPTNLFTNALANRLAGEEWATTEGIWTTFLGSPSLLQNQELFENSVTRQPRAIWRDREGHANTLVPHLIAVEFASRTENVDISLSRWSRLVCTGLDAETAVQIIGGSIFSPTLNDLAWSLTQNLDPFARFSEIWQRDARWLRTQARFSGYQMDRNVVAACVALIRIGIIMLGHIMVRDADKTLLAAQVIESVDEVRLTYLETGLDDWSGLVAELTGQLAAIGMLSTVDGCAALLRRYDGDDASLSAAVVTAVRNGTSAAIVNEALGIFGQSAVGLLKRWELWNHHHLCASRGHYGFIRDKLRAIADCRAVG